MADRDFQIVVFGATGYVGALTAEYLATHAPAGTRIALAGRSASKLEQARAALPATSADWPLLVADTGDPASLTVLAARTDVLATTVGPYLRYGLPVVEACATAGTHYADLTGEVLFVREAVDRFGALAADSGARIVHSCGYDSIPSDLAVLLLHEQAVADGAGELTDVTMVATIKGGFSGGTIDSMRAQLEAIGTDSSLRRVAGSPWSLSPDRSAEPDTDQPSDAPLPGRRGPRNDWTAPFVMASYNTRIVRRSNALLDYSYGRGLRYAEVMGFGSGRLAPVLAGATTVGLAAGMAAFSQPRLRPFVDRVLPKPGEGPSPEARERGWFRHDVEAVTTSKTRYTATVAGKGDPGYAATAVMLGESALCLALDELPDRAGSLTPATAMGDRLVDRLRSAGHTYRVNSE
jgi:short subunit dehydrogenase-like uncharacterized protein